MGKKQKQKNIAKKSGRMPLVATVAAVCIALFVFWVARNSSPKWEVPDYLAGRWISSAPSYQGRYLEINKVSLIFATGPTTVSEYFITALTTSTTANETSIAIESKDPLGITYQFLLIYQPDSGTLFFKNKPQVKWMKSPS